MPNRVNYVLHTVVDTSKSSKYHLSTKYTFFFRILVYDINLLTPCMLQFIRDIRVYAYTQYFNRVYAYTLNFSGLHVHADKIQCIRVSHSIWVVYKTAKSQSICFIASLKKIYKYSIFIQFYSFLFLAT